MDGGGGVVGADAEAPAAALAHVPRGWAAQASPRRRQSRQIQDEFERKQRGFLAGTALKII